MPTPISSTALPATQTISVTPDLDFKIGQMLMIGFRGLTLNDNPIVQELRDLHIGAVVLFDYDVPTQKYERNIQSPAQLLALTDALQKNSRTRLLIAIDQEGGRVARLKERYGFPPSMSQQSLGEQNDLEQTRRAAETTAQTLAAHGINLNLAPAVDLNVNPDNPIIGKVGRSFSADPTIVTNHARAVIAAHHKLGVLTTLKHFPGHGSSKDDSHLGFVDVTQTWTRTELEPFAKLIAAGQADAIMTAHVFNAKLDPELPATLSRKIIGGILRDELRYDGVVISDDLQMKAIAAHYGLATALELAVNAGVDMIALGNNLDYEPGLPARAFNTLKQLVRDGKISTARIDQASQRIARLKARLV